MSYDVIQLITNAYYASGIVSREFETVSGSQMNDGLQFLNDILADKAIEKDMVPYFTKYEFFAIAGQEQYFIPNLEAIETLTFFLNNVRYQMREINRKVYFGSSRANNINSLPFNWHMERCLNGANLFLYFFPQTNYPLEIWGTFRLTSVVLNQDLNSNVGSANLGICTVGGTGAFNPGQLVINNVDLAGTYATPAALVAHINTGVIPFVNAQIVGTQFTLFALQGNNITLSTTGSQGHTNYVTFSSFNTQNGPLNQTFLPQGLDLFYINYLKFSLAERLCTEFNFIVPPGVAKQLLQYQNWISKRSAPLDMTQSKISGFSNGSSLSYQNVNLSLGWGIS
ncbi:MAG: portal protein [Caudoviricetes sp.]|nr:MAG: portal protein [Caudoviricetes sp.]